MSTQTDTDVLQALAGLRVVCDVGHEGWRGNDMPCPNPADWTAKCHAPEIDGECPYPFVICTYHLEPMLTLYAMAGERLRLLHSLIVTKCCAKTLTGLHDMVWDVQRLHP